MLRQYGKGFGKCSVNLGMIFHFKQINKIFNACVLLSTAYAEPFVQSLSKALSSVQCTVPTVHLYVRVLSPIHIGFDL